MTIKLNRRKFVTSTLAASAGAATSLSITNVQDILGGKSNDNVIAAILKHHLPNIRFEEASLQAYSKDLLQRLGNSRNQSGQAFAGAFKNTPSSQQLEHYIVQDFLLKSDALTAVQHQQAVSYTA